MALRIIAEAGSNHCGRLDLAEELVRVAARARADYFKVQMFEWRDIRTDGGEGRDPALQLDRHHLREIAGFCWKAGIEFLCTPFSLGAVAEVDPLVGAWKISSAEAGREALVRACAKTGKPLFISTGYLDKDRLLAYRRWAHGLGAGQVILFHCVASYPARPDAYALGETHRIFYESGPWGISDHTVGTGTAVGAVALGARVVEKHFRLDDQPPSPDNGPHACRPDELGAYVAALWQVEQAISGTLAAPAPRPGRVLWHWLEK